MIAVPSPGAPRDAKYRIEADQQVSQRVHLERLRALGRYVEIRFENPDQLALQILRSSIFDLLVRAEVVSALDDFKRLHEVSRSLSRESERLRRAERDRRMDMAKLFDELFAYANRLPDKIRKELGDDEAQRIGSMLRSAYNVEGVAMRLQVVPAEKERYLREIDEAAGEFQALANLVRLG